MGQGKQGADETFRHVVAPPSWRRLAVLETRGHFLILCRETARFDRIAIVNVPHYESLYCRRARRKMGNVAPVPGFKKQGTEEGSQPAPRERKSPVRAAFAVNMSRTRNPPRSSTSISRRRLQRSRKRVAQPFLAVRSWFFPSQARKRAVKSVFAFSPR